MRTAVAILAAAFILGGCAKYEYDIVQPADASRRIGKEMDAVVQVEPLEYRFRTVDNRLVVRIFNQTDENLQLLGDKSSVVDPDGQSHPLRGGPIAPRSFLKLIIPPPRPQVYDSRPTFGVGVGVGMSRYYRRHPYYHTWYNDYYYDPFYSDHYYSPYHLHYVDPSCAIYDEPRYFAVYDDSDTRYWEWRGEGEARLNLVFQRGDKEFKHEFMFRRRKV